MNQGYFQFSEEKRKIERGIEEDKKKELGETMFASKFWRGDKDNLGKEGGRKQKKELKEGGKNIFCSKKKK